MTPLIDLKKRYGTINEEVGSAIQAVLDRGRDILGPEVKQREQQLADFAGSKYPKPMHTTAAFAYSGCSKGSIFVAEGIFAPPHWPYMRESTIERITGIIGRFTGRRHE